MTDRGSIIKIGENDYELILTTRATKEIAKRYGGLENLGDRLMKSENLKWHLMNHLAYHLACQSECSHSQPQKSR